MDKRYQIEEAQPTDPDGGFEWVPLEPLACSDKKHIAIAAAQLRIKIGEHGESAVRVFDTVAQKIVWTNC